MLSHLLALLTTARSSLRNLPSYRLEVYDASSKSTLADVANFSDQSCQGHSSYRFPYRPNRNSKTNDCIIAATALEHQCRLLHNDKDFKPITEHFSLETIHNGPFA
ncbi:PIN domain-containing protein [Gammaproteobacteria bacterium]|nr:PIN domain-containing protein [Gammaproteobacteria bacterium]